MWVDVDRVEILSSLLPIIMISYTDATLVGELLSFSVYTVYLIAYDGNCWTHYMTTATMIM